MDRGVAAGGCGHGSDRRTLIDAGVDADGISVLRSPADAAAPEESPCRLLPKALQGG